jgi:hypothetical protein
MLIKNSSFTVIFCLLLSLKGYSVNYIKDGYTDKRSYNQGDTVRLYINAISAATGVKLKLVTINNTVADSFLVTISPQTIHNSNPAQEGFGYYLSGYYVLPKTLPSGIYNIEKKIFLIVKDVNKKSDIVVIYPSSSEEAYNNAGNRKSTYEFNSAGTPVTTVSFLRPLSPFVIDSMRLWSSAFLKWIQRKKINNYTVSYIADIDLEDYKEVKNSKILIVIGHSEYWSLGGRRNFDRFVYAGNHAIVLSGNTMWWQIRYSTDKTKLTCYKEANDPIDNPLLRTTHWGNPILNYQTLFSLGADFTNSGYGLKYGNGWHGFKIAIQNSPLLEGTGLEKGDIVSCPSYEMDGTVIKGFNKGYPIVNNDSLKFCQVEILAFDFTQCHAAGCNAVGTFIVFKRYSNSGNVMNVASMDWCGEPAFWFAPETGGMGGRDSLKLQKITQNMIVKSMTDANIFTTAASKYCTTSPNELNELPELTIPEFSLYPNPGSGQLFIETNNHLKAYSFQLFDLEGRMVFSKEKLSGLHNELLLDVANPGIYYYRIFSNNSPVKAGKLIIQK